jgi:hypothetical protein
MHLQCLVCRQIWKKANHTDWLCPHYHRRSSECRSSGSVYVWRGPRCFRDGYRHLGHCRSNVSRRSCHRRNERSDDVCGKIHPSLRKLATSSCSMLLVSYDSSVEGFANVVLNPYLDRHHVCMGLCVRWMAWYVSQTSRKSLQLTRKKDTDVPTYLA